MYIISHKWDAQHRLVAMKLRLVENRWNSPDPYMMMDRNSRVRDNCGPNLPGPRYTHSPITIIMRFSTNEDGWKPVLRSMSIDNESHIMKYDDLHDYYEADTHSEWQFLCYNNPTYPFIDPATGRMNVGFLPLWAVTSPVPETYSHLNPHNPPPFLLL